jgi:hypothetical protein
MSNTKKSIIGVIDGYRWPAIAPFVRSWHQNTRSTDLHLICGAGINAQTRDQLQAHGVIIHDMATVTKGAGADLCAALASGHIVVSRFGMIASLLREEAISDGPCLVVDVRDIVFQGDIGLIAPTSGIAAALEPRFYGSCEFNDPWMLQAYGAQELEKMNGRQISCVGSIFGCDKSTTERAVSKLAEEMARHDDQFFGLDTAAYNYLLKEEQLGPSTGWPTTSSGIMTMGFIKGCKVDGDGIIRDPEGNIPAIVHQYDRDKRIKKAMLKKYGCGFWERRRFR